MRLKWAINSLFSNKYRPRPETSVSKNVDAEENDTVYSAIVQAVKGAFFDSGKESDKKSAKKSGKKSGKKSKKRSGKKSNKGSDKEPVKGIWEKFKQNVWPTGNKSD